MELQSKCPPADDCNVDVDFSTERIVITAFFLIAGRLGVLYMRRLDAKQAGDLPAKRRAIAASRRRAQGHMWFVGVILAAPFAVLLPVSDGPPLSIAIAVSLVLTGFVALCIWRMLRAYGDARRIAAAR